MELGERANYSHVHIHLRVETENCAYSLGILIMYAFVARDVDVKTNAPTKKHPYRKCVLRFKKKLRTCSITILLNQVQVVGVLQLF